MKNTLLLILLWIGFYPVYGQKQNNKWIFGDRYFDFNSGRDSGAVFNAPNNFIQTYVAFEGCSSVSDRTTGKLLFFSNSLSIYNADYEIMANGDSVYKENPNLIFPSSTNGSVIVPVPKSLTQYYVFSVASFLRNSGISYSVVDMTLNGGKGGVIAGKKNITLTNLASEKLTAAPSSDGQFYWIMTHDAGNNNFRAYRATACGVDTHAVVSAIGSAIDSAGAFQSFPTTKNKGGWAGYMKFNPQYKLLANATQDIQNRTGGIEIFDFDNATGKLSNVRRIELGKRGDYMYSIEFSPNGKLLYAMAEFGFELLQFDASLGTATQIANSLQRIGDAGQGLSMQLGPDNKIYAASGTNEPGIINNPDVYGSGCNYVETPNRDVFVIAMSLPQKVFDLNPIPYPSNGIDTTLACIGRTSRFKLLSEYGIKKVLWNFGDPVSGVDNTSTSLTPSHLFTDLGKYKISVKITYFNCEEVTFTIDQYIPKCSRTNGAAGFCKMNIPNAFSPDNDALNDAFLPVSNCNITDYHLRIYDRWGSKIFETTTLTEAWKGSINNQRCPDGVYAYILKYKIDGGSEIVEDGNVTILR